MPTKKNKKVSPLKKNLKKIPAKKLTAKKSTPKKSTKKVLVKKIPEKKVLTKKPAPKLVKKIKALKPAPKNKEIKKVIPKKILGKKLQEKVEKKAGKKVEKHSLAKAILAKGSSKEKTFLASKIENENSVEKKFDSSKKTILVRKNEDSSKLNFKVGDYAIYPSHGVGKISGIEKTMISDHSFNCYLMTFEREKLTIKIPAINAKKIGLRHPISKQEMDEVFVILRSGIKKLKGMWSRRAQEYETKINSGDIILLAEVIRDLTRDIEDSERSYSERIIYETAIYRLASEYEAIHKVSFEEAKEKIVTTAKDKLTGETRSTAKDDFDDFDDFEGGKKSGESDEEENEDEEEEEEDEDDDFSFDDDDDDAPKKRKKKK
ncbi:MAG: hypothetical protein KGP29_01545 [Proteobacteria bacterium]|nr:hypothetical protein [Pseudomonadota bacterium]